MDTLLDNREKKRKPNNIVKFFHVLGKEKNSRCRIMLRDFEKMSQIKMKSGKQSKLYLKII